MTSYYCFDTEYFELPFSSDLAPINKELQDKEFNLVYVRTCAKGYMLFSLEHKFFFYKASKQAKNLIDALEHYVADKTMHVRITYKLTEKGLPKFVAYTDENKGRWIEDITGYSFMSPDWNNSSISEAHNEFLIPGAKGETEIPAHEQKSVKKSKGVDNK
jgi:hypothetical protein